LEGWRLNVEVSTRAGVEAKLLDLIEGRCSRDEASSRAEAWIVRDLEEDLIDALALLEALQVV
jgi:hypothetical protein